jgi:hypothetical protein
MDDSKKKEALRIDHQFIDFMAEQVERGPA